MHMGCFERVYICRQETNDRLYFKRYDFENFDSTQQRVRMMFGVFPIVPNTNIDGNDLQDSVK